MELAGAWQQECAEFDVAAIAQSGATQERATAHPKRTAKLRRSMFLL